MRKNNSSLFSLIALLCLTASVQGLSSDNKKVMVITAHQAVFNRDKSTATYIGKVKLDQGTTHLRADTLTNFFNKKHKITLSIATGQLAKYQTLPAKNKAILYASAEKIHYLVDKHRMTLIKKASVTQGGDHFSGPYLIYNTQTKIMIAKPVAKQRTTVILDTSNNATSSENSP